MTGIRLFAVMRRALLLLAALVLAYPAAARPRGPTVHSVLDIHSPLEIGEYLWEPQLGRSGPVEIVVDVAAHRLYVYKGGAEIGRSLIIYGADDKPTPLGTFPILEKDIDHVSNLYDAPMPYMLRLTWDGIAIHGSGEVVDDVNFATHGCIGLPNEFAALLYRMAKLGDRVTVTRGWMTATYFG